MKRSFLFLLFVVTSVSLMAQVKKKPAAASPAAAPMPIKTSTDSLSYAIGVSVAGFFKAQGVENVNTAMVSRAINDVLKKNQPVLNEQQCNNVITSYVQKMREEKSSVNKKAGQAFLEQNKKKEGIVVLPSGLQYQVITQGTGPKPTATDTVRCAYKGTLIDGTEFDSSEKQGGPIEFPVNRVIAGWTEALQLMPVGSKWRLFIPSNLGYGDQQAGPVIKPGSTLIFEVELVSIVNNK